MFVIYNINIRNIIYNKLEVDEQLRVKDEILKRDFRKVPYCGEVPYGSIATLVRSA